MFSQCIFLGGTHMKNNRLVALLLGISMIAISINFPFISVNVHAVDGVDLNNDIKDSNFRKYLSEEFDWDNDGNLDSEEMPTYVYIDENWGIESLEGINLFTDLEILKIFDNPLNTLDLSENTALKTVECYCNNLNSLNVSNCTALEELNCSNNSLSNINLSDCVSLKELYCAGNKLTSLNLENCTKLQDINCQGNNLLNINLKNCNQLMYFNCEDNQLEELDLSNKKKLATIWYRNNPLIKLDLSNCINLDLQFIQYPPKTEQLILSGCTNIQEINYSYSSSDLKKLDVSNCTSLKAINVKIMGSRETLGVEYGLQYIDASGCTSLKSIDCFGNNLSFCVRMYFANKNRLCC